MCGCSLHKITYININNNTLRCYDTSYVCGRHFDSDIGSLRVNVHSVCCVCVYAFFSLEIIKFSASNQKKTKTSVSKKKPKQNPCMPCKNIVTRGIKKPSFSWSRFEREKKIASQCKCKCKSHHYSCRWEKHPNEQKWTREKKQQRTGTGTKWVREKKLIKWSWK